MEGLGRPVNMDQLCLKKQQKKKKEANHLEVKRISWLCIKMLAELSP